jgi:hypothetical protein
MFDDVLLDPAANIRSAARRDWRWYAPGWAFPLVALSVWHLSRVFEGTFPESVVTVLLSIYQGAAFFLAGSLVFFQRATFRQFAVLALLVPLGIWALAVFARGALLAAIGRLDLA